MRYYYDIKSTNSFHNSDVVLLFCNRRLFFFSFSSPRQCNEFLNYTAGNVHYSACCAIIFAVWGVRIAVTFANEKIRTDYWRALNVVRARTGGEKKTRRRSFTRIAIVRSSFRGPAWRSRASGGGGSVKIDVFVKLQFENQSRKYFERVQMRPYWSE